MICHRSSLHRLLVLLASGLLTAPRPATAAQVEPAPAPGAELSVFLVTMGQGTAIWERFGHNAIWIHDERLGSDRLYTYGLFSWEQEHFLLRFIQGRMVYRAGSFNVEPRLAQYVAANRSVWLQELELSARQRVDLRQFLEWNVQPENAAYPYNYYWDNCSTRVRDALDRVLEGQIRQQTELRKGATYRFHTLRFAGGGLLLHTGLLLGLGRPVDQPKSAWDEMFLPTYLRDHIKRVRVVGPDGAVRPLVRSERTLFLSDRPPVPAVPPSWLIVYLAVGALLAGLLIFIAGQARRRPAARKVFTALATLYGAAVGLVGFLLVFLWAFTDHTTSYWNENVILFNPAFALLAVMVALRGLGLGQLEKPVVWLAAALAVTSLLGFALQLLPGWDQVNGELFALALAPNLALAMALARAPRVGTQTGEQGQAPAGSDSVAS